MVLFWVLYCSSFRYYFFRYRVTSPESHVSIDIGILFLGVGGRELKRERERDGGKREEGREEEGERVSEREMEGERENTVGETDRVSENFMLPFKRSKFPVNITLKRSV